MTHPAPDFLSRFGVATLLAGVDNFVVLANAFQCRSCAEVPRALEEVSRALVDTARGLNASEGALAGYVRDRWKSAPGRTIADREVGDDVYVTAIRLLHRAWAPDDS